jgi:NitT/TauT family transport system substrate-binding protein
MLFCACARRPEPPIRVGATVWPGYEPLFLARSLGYLEGRPFKLAEYPTRPEALRAFSNGALEAVALTSDEFLRLAAEEPDVRAILVIDISKGADALVAQPEVTSIDQLKGKRIGVEANAAGIYLLEKALETRGMTIQDVQVLQISNDRQIEAYRRHELDAVITFEPQLTTLLKTGANVLFDSSKLRGELMDLLVVRNELIQQRRARLKELITVWFKARDYFHQYPAKAAELVACREALDAQSFLSTLPLIEFPELEKNRVLLDHDQPQILFPLKRIAEVLLSLRMLPNAEVKPELLEGGLLP